MSEVEHLKDRLHGSVGTVESLVEDVDSIHQIGKAIIACFERGGTLYTCGNGGSAAEAMHLAEELIGRYQKGDRPPQRAICLNADPTALTCIANDFGYDAVFARQCEALLTESDVLVVLSTSGNSANILRALEVATRVGATTIGLLGKHGGESADRCDLNLIVHSDDSAHIQEAHLVIIHLVCEMVEAAAHVPRRES